MKYFLCLFALLGFAAATLISGLRARYSEGPGAGVNYFYDVPRTICDVEAAGWARIERPPSPLPTLVMYCTKGLIFCTLYRPDTGAIAGIQIGIPLNRIIGALYDWHQQGFIEWIPEPCDGEEAIKYMTKQMYFISEESLTKSQGDDSERCSDDVLTEGVVWLTGFYGKLVEISTRAVDIENSMFTKQACIPKMGRHFFFNMTTTTECKATTIFNWFLLVHNGKLVGIGFVVAGKVIPVKGERFWMEQTNLQITKAIVPRGPKCLYKGAVDPTYTSLHIYFRENPWMIDCEGQ